MRKIAKSPHTGKTEEDPVYFTDEKGETISITPYHSGFVAYIPDIHSGLCGGDLRKLAIALILAADRVDQLNRSYEAGEINNISTPTENIPIVSLHASPNLQTA